MAYRWESLTHSERIEQWQWMGRDEIYVPLQEFWLSMKEWTGRKTFAVAALMREINVTRSETLYDFQDLWKKSSLRRIARKHHLNPSLGVPEIIATLRFSNLLKSDVIVDSPLFNDLIQKGLSYREILCLSEDHQLFGGVYMDLMYKTLGSETDIQVKNWRKKKHLYYVQRIPLEERVDIHISDSIENLDQLVALLLMYEPRSNFYLILNRSLKTTDLNSFVHLGFVPYLDWMVVDRADSSFYGLQTAFLSGVPLSVEDIPENRELWVRPSTKSLWNHGQTSPAYYYHLFAGRTYPHSHRAYTRMDQLIFDSEALEKKAPLTPPISSSLKTQLETGALVELVPGLVFILAVSRYALGMSKGLYFTGEDLDYCGTFYYAEPYSDVVLTISSPHKLLVAENKTQALFKLYQKDGFSSLDLDIPDFGNVVDEYLQRLVDHPGLGPYLQKQGGENIFLPEIPHSVFRFSKYLERAYQQSQEFPLSKEVKVLFRRWLMVIYYLLGINMENLFPKEDNETYFDLLYAFEDPWDQPVCRLARKLGYEVVLLNNMVGRHRLVSEVLDTRPRETSLSSLKWLR